MYLRPLASGLGNSLAHLLGDVPSPPLIAWLQRETLLRLHEIQMHFSLLNHAADRKIMNPFGLFKVLATVLRGEPKNCRNRAAEHMLCAVLTPIKGSSRTESGHEPALVLLQLESKRQLSSACPVHPVCPAQLAVIHGTKGASVLLQTQAAAGRGPLVYFQHQAAFAMIVCHFLFQSWSAAVNQMHTWLKICPCQGVRLSSFLLHLLYSHAKSHLVAAQTSHLIQRVSVSERPILGRNDAGNQQARETMLFVCSWSNAQAQPALSDCSRATAGLAKKPPVWMACFWCLPTVRIARGLQTCWLQGLTLAQRVQEICKTGSGQWCMPALPCCCLVPCTCWQPCSSRPTSASSATPSPSTPWSLVR